MRNKCIRYGFIIATILMFLAITSNITYAESQMSQSSGDTPSKWAKAEIDKAKEMNLIPEKLYEKYKSNIIREEFCEIAVNLYESLSGKKGVLQGENPFSDTQNEKIIIANSLGIVNGIGNGKFAPEDPITRQEMAVMLYRTLQAARPAYDYSGSYEHVFDDYESISTWARKAVGYLYGIEVMNGVGENMFAPKENTSREQAFVLAKRLYDKASTSWNSLTVSRAGTSRQQSAVKLKLAKLMAQEMGKPYQWGGTGPDSYDCSGLVYSLYGKLGITLPRVASSQALAGTYVPKEELEYGDLVFFARDGKNVNHVGIYVGNGEFVHAPQTGDVVKKTTLLSGYYANCYYTARRVIE